MLKMSLRIFRFNLTRLFLFVSFFGFSQDLYFNPLEVNNELTKSDVSCLIQDSSGFLWIGTDDGLNKYDGNKVHKFYTRYNDEHSLSGNRITCMYEDSRKRIWIGTEGNGLNYYSIENQRFYRVETQDKYQYITSITEDNFNEIIIGTTKGLLVVKENKSTPFIEVLQCPLNGVYINKIISHDNSSFIATTTGVWVRKNNKFNHLKNFGNDFYNNIIIDDKNRIWALQRFKIRIASLFKDEHDIFELETNPEYTFKSLGKSNDGDIWIGTLNHGLLQVHSETLKIKEKYSNSDHEERSLNNNSITSIYCDSKNTLWITNRYGISYSNLNKQNINSLPLNNIITKGQQSIIRNMIIDNDYIYFIIQDENAYRYNIKTKTNQYINLGNGITPYTINKIKNRVYIGSSNGLYIQKEKNSIDFVKKEYETVNNDHIGKNPSVICEDTYGTIYYGNFNGLIVQKGNVYNWANNITPALEVLKGKRVFTLFFDDLLNCLWIGTISNGLYKMTLDTKGNFLSIEEFNKQLKNDYYIPNNNIWGIYRSSSQDLWITTDSGLLNLPRNENTFDLIESPNLRNKKIMGIIEDPYGKLWVTSSKSLINYDPITKKETNYTYKDGLSSNFITKAISIKDSVIYVGTFQGINNFKHQIQNPKKTDYHINFTNFKIHNTTILPEQAYLGSTPLKSNINLSDQITLNHKQNNFLIEFATNNYLNSYRDKYRYKLKGYDKNWKYTDNEHKFVSYSNLNRGNYNFIIQLQNSEGKWDTSSKEILFKIVPAPWLSWYAYLIYFSIFCLIAYTVFFFWLKKQKLKHELEVNKILIKKEHDLNELKLIFFTDIAHEFKTPLSLIIGPLKDLNFKELTSDKFKFNYHIITRNTQRMMYLVNQLLDFRKINADQNILNVSKSNLTSFVSEICNYFMWQAQSASISFNIISAEEKKCYFDKDIIEKVMFNLLSNAFKYTPNNGTIEVETKIIWKQERKYANIIIKDSGKGISDIDKKQIFQRYFHGKERSSSGVGLHLSYNLIKAHKGEIIATDSSLGGTEFIVSIPVERAHYNEYELNSNPDKAIKEERYDYLGIPKELAQKDDSILIVEDDHDLRLYLKTCLQSKYKILEATNGIEGLDIALKEIPDIIISDVMMPEMDGVTMCEKLKENQTTSHIPVLILTAKTDDEFKSKGLIAGAWDYISKPFNTADVIQKINNIVKTQHKFKQLLAQKKPSILIKKHYTSFDQKLITKLTELVEENISKNDFSVEELANCLGFSRMQLHRKLKALTGQSTTGFINSIKINYVSHMFDNGCDRIQEAMDAIGINSYSHFNKIFKELKGITPSEYMNNSKSRISNIS